MGNLKVMREDTWKGVGDWRIELAEKQIYPRVQALIASKGAADGEHISAEEEVVEESKEGQNADQAN